MTLTPNIQVVGKIQRTLDETGETMITIRNAERLCKTVRKALSKGYKSYNKVYEDGHDKQEARQQQADEARRRTDAFRKGMGLSDHWSMAQVLAKMPMTELAGNCQEMALLAAYGTVKLNWGGTPYIGKIGGGAHAFCLIAPQPLAKVEFSTIKALTDTSITSIIMDPWLNVACYAIACGERVDIKLDDWQQGGKRIRLNEETTSTPKGQFRTELFLKGVELKKFEEAGFEALLRELNVN